MGGSSPTSTPIQLSPPMFPPGYGFSKGFYDQILPGLLSQPYPTYPGQLDPGMSPTAANALRQAQDYSVSPYSNTIGAIRGSIGQFMNPRFENPAQALRPAPNYGFGNTSGSSSPFMPPSQTAQRPTGHYGLPQPFGNDMIASPGARPAGFNPNDPSSWGGPSTWSPYGGGGMSKITGQSRSPSFGGEGTGAELPDSYYGLGNAPTADPMQPAGPFSRRPSPGVGPAFGNQGGGGGGGFGGGGGGGGADPAAAGTGSGIGLSEILQGAGLLGGLLGGGGGGSGGFNFAGGGGEPATPNLPSLRMGYQPMPGGQGFLPFAPGSSNMSLAGGVGAASSVAPGSPMPGGGGGAPQPGAGQQPLPSVNWSNTQDPLAILPKGQLPWLGRWTGPNKGKSKEEVVFDNWTRGWPMGNEYQPPPHLVEAARAAGQPFEFGARQTHANETPGFYRGYQAQQSGGGTPSPAPPPGPTPAPAPPTSGGVAGRPVGPVIPAGGGGFSPMFGGSSVAPGSPMPGGAPALRLGGPTMGGGGGAPALGGQAAPMSPSLTPDVYRPASPSSPSAPPPLSVSGGPLQGPPPPSDAFGPTSAMDVYRSAAPVMEQEMQDRISEAMAASGLTGNRFSSSSQNIAAREGSRAGLRQNELMGNLLYGQTQQDLNRQLQSNTQAMELARLEDALATNRIQLPFEIGKWEQGRQDLFSNTAFQDWSQNRLGFLTLLMQMAQSPGTGSQGQFGAMQTGGSPGALDYFSALAPILAAAGGGQ